MDINNFMSTKEYAKTLDQEDPLVSYREEFYLNPGMIYMDGNSLGLLSKRAEKSLMKSLEDWKKYGIDGWTEGAEPQGFLPNLFYPRFRKHFMRA